MRSPALVFALVASVGCDPAAKDTAKPASTLGGAPAAEDRTTRTLRVWPLGDSLTRGKREHPSYRYFLERNARLHGITIEYLGGLRGAGGSMAGAAEYDAERFPEFRDLDHDGHADQEIGQIDAQFDAWSAAVQDPEWILLIMGTNDAYHDQALAHSLAAARRFMPRLKARFPEATIVPALPPPIRIDEGREGIEALRGPLRQIYEAHGFDPIDLAAGWRPEFLHRDGLHTNAAGDAFIAAKFALRLGWPVEAIPPR